MIALWYGEIRHDELWSHYVLQDTTTFSTGTAQLTLLFDQLPHLARLSKTDSHRVATLSNPRLAQKGSEGLRKSWLCITLRFSILQPPMTNNIILYPKRPRY